MAQNDEYWNHQMPYAGQLPQQPVSGMQAPPDAQQPADAQAPSESQQLVGEPALSAIEEQVASQEQLAGVPVSSAIEEQVAVQEQQVPAVEADDAPPSDSVMAEHAEDQAAFQQPQLQQSQQPVQQPQPQPQPQPQQPQQPTQQPQPQQPAGSWAPQNQAFAQAPGARAPQPAYAPSTQYQAVGAQQKKGGHGWIVAIVVVVCLCALMAFTVKTCTDSMSSLTNFSSSSTSSLANLTGDAVAVLELDGTIQYDGSACRPEGFKKLLDQAQKNEHVKALVIRVNSGGGTATAGEEMAEYLRQFDKPVVVSSASINASAAYEISAQADYIYVAKSTEIGAIGTAMEVTDLSGLLEKLGIRMETITSADSKDSSYGYRPLSDDERAYYQDMINQINEMFIENVAEGRHMDIEEVRKLATGLVFTGVDSVKNGLSDEIGTREDAIKKAAELAEITDYTTAELSFSSYDLGELAYLFGNDRSSTEELIELLHEYGRTDVTH